MRRLIKASIAIFTVFLILLSAGWYYVTSKVASELNAKYADKKISLKNLENNDYFISFKNVEAAGFPYRFSWKINQWKEESRTSEIEYSSPIYVGYDLLKQELFVEYNGDIIAHYKPKQHGFGSRLSVDHYNIAIDLPLSISLITTLTQQQDPVRLLNYIDNVYVGTRNVEIFDLVDNEKYYDKEFEDLNIKFTPAKHYTDMEDFLNNIPQHYEIQYDIKTNPNNAEIRRLPVSLFYGFALMPSGMDLDLNATIKTQATSYKDYRNGLQVNARLNADSPYFTLDDVKTDYYSTSSQNIINHHLKKTGQFSIKPGFFDQIITAYKKLNIMQNRGKLTQFVDSEIDYLIKHKDELHLSRLENDHYDLILDVNSEHRGGSIYSKLNDFSIFSKDSGFKVQQTMQQNLLNKKMKADGVVHLRNYPAIVEFVSAYIYRFGKYRALSDDARELYVGVNKSFLKQISDHPNSTSNDLSISYGIDSTSYSASKIGSTTVVKIIPLYTLTLYQKLFDKVGLDGDVLGKMRQIIPSIDGNEPMLKNILPKISIKEKLQESVNKVLPTKKIKDTFLDLVN